MNPESTPKFKVFIEVAGVLNKHNITPILFGSLGLSRAIGGLHKVNDIDILVPDKFVDEKWNQLIRIMGGLNFKLQDEHEHEFVRNSEIVAFGKVSGLVELSQINPDTLTITEFNKVKFEELSAEQYLLCYQKMLRDEYRQEKRSQADQEKISLIQQYLENRK